MAKIGMNSRKREIKLYYDNFDIVTVLFAIMIELAWHFPQLF